MYKYILNYNCYASDNLCCSISFNKNGSCDKCIEKYGIKTMNDLYLNYTYQKKIIVPKIKILIRECEGVEKDNMKSRAIICLKIFNIISKNLYFIFENKVLLMALIKKCNEFKKDYDKINEVLISNPKYEFSRDFIVNINKFYEENINYDMNQDNQILNDFDIFISDYMDNYIKLNKENKENKENKSNEKIKNNSAYCDEIIYLDI